MRDALAVSGYKVGTYPLDVSQTSSLFKHHFPRHRFSPRDVLAKMFSNAFLSAGLLLASLTSVANASLSSHFHRDAPWNNRLAKRTYYPAPATDYYTIKTPTNVTIRYKTPGEEGVCETTPGVGSYSGYVDLSEGIQHHLNIMQHL